MKYHLLIRSLIILSLISCGSIEEDETISQEAEDYLNEVLDIMQSYSINKYTIDWTDFRTQVFEKVGSAQSIRETYPGVQEALALLSDNHSGFRTSEGDYLFAGQISCGRDDITAPDIPENIGYVKVNWFSGSSGITEATLFAEEIRDQIRNSDKADLTGWIVDLRGNLGGNMYPMLAGVAPILGDGIAGYFIDPDDNAVSWSVSGNASYVNEDLVIALSESYELITPNPKVAVLLDNGVASSGEVVAISFIGRENTRSFGSPTCGLSTANSPFTLGDNSILNLTVSYLADRDKNIFGIPVEPDVMVDDLLVVQSAIDWIME